MNTTSIVIFALLMVALVVAEWRVLKRNKQLEADLRNKQSAVDFLHESNVAFSSQLKGYRAQADERIAVLTENNRGLEARLSARNVSWTMPAKLPSRNEIRRAFAVDNDAPLWVALNFELDSFLQDLIDQVSVPPGPMMNEETRTHLAGGIEQVRLFQKRLLDLHASAKNVDDDIVGEGPKQKGGDLWKA